MEPETGAAAKGKDSDDDQNAPDSSSQTGKKADQDQQILMDAGDTNWYKNTQALKYLQPVFMPIVRDKMKSLQLQSMTDFGRQLCAEATADDIIRANDNLAQFKHVCPGTVVACQNLLNIIKGHTSDSDIFYQMLKGTDPQQWLKSPFEFVRLFLKDWMRRDIHDFQECDITALCTIVKRCKPLMQIFDERKIDDLRKLRNWTMHPATMSISRQEMEHNIDVILDFLEHIKSLKSTDEVTEAIESIKQLRTGDVRLLHSMVVRLIQGWLPCARIVYEHKSEQAKNQLQDINYMETMLARLSSGQEITSLRQSAEHEFEVKKEDKRELEKQNEELIKRLKEEKRELEKQNEELSKRLNEVKRKLEKQNEGPRKRLETIERRSLDEVCRPKEISTQRSPDLGPSPATGCTDVSAIPVKSDKDKGPCYITGMAAISGTQLMLADESNKCIKLLDPEIGTVIRVKKEKNRELEKQKEKLRKRLNEVKRELEKHNEGPRKCLETIKRRSLGEVCLPKEISTQRSPDLGSSPATGFTGVSTMPVKSDKDKGPCYITGMTAISGTQLMLADERNRCIKLLDPERGTKENNREFVKQKEELRKRLNEVKRELEKHNEGPRKCLGTIKRRSLGEVCLPKEISTQRSPDDATEVEELPKRAASVGERLPTQALSASTSSDAKRRRISEEFSKPQPLFHPPRKTLPTLEKLHLGPSPATGFTDVSTMPVKSDKDKRRCYITGMVAISETQLMLADKNNKCIKLLDLETGTVIGVKGFRSAPHDVTCVPGSRIAVTIPAFHRIHVFTADKNLNKCGTMSVNGFCFGIHCSGDRFFVSCKDPPLVQIMNMEGVILKTIKLDSVEYPVYLTCSPDNNFIYVCDSCNDVSCMVMTGRVQWRYNFRRSKSEVQTLPQGVCTGDGCIYICIFDEIHVVSPTGTKLEVIPFSLKEADNTAVCYSSQKKTLYVSRCPSADEKNTYISRIRMH